jgi:hypothetical protein
MLKDPEGQCWVVVCEFGGSRRSGWKGMGMRKVFLFVNVKWVWGKGTYRLGEHGCLRRPMHEGGGLCGYSLLEFNWVGSTAGRNNELELE